MKQYAISHKINKDAWNYLVVVVTAAHHVKSSRSLMHESIKLCTADFLLLLLLLLNRATFPMYLFRLTNTTLVFRGLRRFSTVCREESFF